MGLRPTGTEVSPSLWSWAARSSSFPIIWLLLLLRPLGFGGKDPSERGGIGMALSSSSSGSSSEGMSSTCCSSSTSPVDELISSGSLSSWPFLGSFLLLTCPDGWEDGPTTSNTFLVVWLTNCPMADWIESWISEVSSVFCFPVNHVSPDPALGSTTGSGSLECWSCLAGGLTCLL